MLNFFITTEKDRREAAKIEQRRAREEERKQRIFNPRARLIGIDALALQHQVEEKKQRNDEERNIDKIFKEQLKKADEIAMVLEQKECEERRRVQEEIINFRRLHQRPEDRREFDLNDPDAKKKQLPCRVNDDDPRLGISAAQKFEGEDLVSEERRKMQNEETKAYLEQQIREKVGADKEQKQAEDAYIAAMIARDQRALELDSLEIMCRKKIQEAAVKFNQALASEKLCEKQKAEKQITEDDLADICNFLNSDLMTENPDVAQSNFPGKKITSCYKGLTAAERAAFKKELLQQIEQQKELRELEKRRNREMDAYTDGMQKSIYMLDQELKLKEKERKKKLAEENLKLAEEQKSRNRYLDKVVYSNIPSDEFYDQFNRTVR
ncbi:RIB43A-like with coiled-coils protein 2 [Diabrotica virgifera virgifera]|uniref:RIB43A-like with coiled-coils protein 2 n=1 Tax=Diabrotica virgifera virgifera TaxID=50390 RepID=A0ABM5IT27_DIAVI|nr:RIB43A-like with coiled-coils protein 2 [Diabrotica virgifera virgifera]